MHGCVEPREDTIAQSSEALEGRLGLGSLVDALVIDAVKKESNGVFVGEPIALDAGLARLALQVFINKKVLLGSAVVAREIFQEASDYALARMKCRSPARHAS